MLAYVAKRLALALGTVLVAVVITFLLVQRGAGAGGSPGAVRLSPGATAEQITAANEELGWNRPLVVQFLDYLGSLVRGDLGHRSSTAAPSPTISRPACRSRSSLPCSPRSCPASWACSLASPLPFGADD